MTFEKDFPSLKNDFPLMQATIRTYNCENAGDGGFIFWHRRNLIEHYCLDKQRVQKYWTKILKNLNDPKKLKESMEEFEKALNLND